MKKYIFLVEGIADLIFLRDFFKYAIEDTLEVLFSKGVKNDNDSTKLKIIKKENFTIDVFITGGYTAIDKFMKIKLKEFSDFGYEIILVFDTDDPSKPHGGFEERNSYLQKIAVQNKTSFKIFLFPNNKDDGDLENLLLNIVNENKYSPYHTSYTHYANSISSYSSSEFCNELLCHKHIVYNYFQVYFGMEKAREENRDYKKEFWEYNHPHLEPLKRFVKSII